MERQLAIQAAGNWIERLQGEEFTTLFAVYDDWTFNVDGLRAQEGQAAVGSIEFPTIGGQLRETVDDGQLGMPRDLNADGVIDGVSRSDDYLLLPVTVNVAWSGSAGNAEVSLSTFLFDLGS